LVEEVGESGDGGDVVLAGGGEVGAHVGVALRAVEGPEAPGDLAVELLGLSSPIRGWVW
jgi:hypothetical protein